MKQSLWMIAVVVLLALPMRLLGGDDTSARIPPNGQATTLPVPRTNAILEPAAVVQLHGEIDEYSRDALMRRFDQAKAAGARTIILEEDTPGGLVTASLDIARFLRGQDEIHTVAFVNGKALSGGIMVGLACDELVMAPGSLIGDSAPIALSKNGGLETLGQTERAKAESPVLADFYASSIRNGYDPLLTSAMVSLGRVVHFVQSPDGKARRFVDDKAYAKLTSEGWTPVPGVPDPVDQENTLLTVDSVLAQKLGLSRGTYASPEAFAQARGLQIVGTYGPSGADKVVEWFGTPAVRGILIIILLQVLYIAFSHPGHAWPEALSAIVLAVLLGVPLLTGFANWIEVLAILIGLSLLAIEVFVIPGFGLTGILGLVLVFGGLIMTFVGKEPGGMPGWLPSFQGTWINLQRGLLVVCVGLLCSLVLWFWLNRYLPKMPYFNRLILTATTGGTPGRALERPVETGPAVGDRGTAVTDLKPGGSVKFMTESYPEGRIAAVVSDSGYVASGTQVVAHEVAGNRVVVRKA
jgi:membrane-bound serine protease (ClpP class)